MLRLARAKVIRGKVRAKETERGRAIKAKEKESQVQDHPRVDVSFATDRTGCRSARTPP